MPASTCRRRGRPSPGCNAAVHRPGPARAAPGRDGGQGQGARGILAEPLAQLQAQVEYLSDQLIAGVREGRYVAEPWLLFEVRIALAEAAQQAVQLELQASGGAAYLKPAGDGFARRWREAAFLPIVTPSLVQLKTELAKRRAAGRRGGGMSGDMSGRVPVLRARGLTLRYPGADAAVFQDVNLDLARGEVLAVLGASGAGKSSLLRVLAGLQAPSAGALDMEGQRLAGVHPRVAVAFQDPGLLPWLTLERNVAFGLDFKHQPALDARERARRVDLAIEEVGLSHARQLRPAQLSGGMAQRTALALPGPPAGGAAAGRAVRGAGRGHARRNADAAAQGGGRRRRRRAADHPRYRRGAAAGRPHGAAGRRAGGVLGEWAVDLPQPRPAAEMGAAPGNTVPPARRAAGRTRGVRTGGTCLTPHQSKTQGA